MTNDLPPIAVGMPVYNGGNDLRLALDCLVSQSFGDFVLNISDNASTDDTETICRQLARIDPRVRYFRQSENIGAEANFRFVFHAADTEYFMWAAADDLRSADFLESNLKFLQSHSDYVASTCPVRFRGGDFDEVAMGDRALAHDDPCERVVAFFDGWHANGRFYSLFRRAEVAHWIQLDHRFLGADWTLVTHLAKTGKLNRLDQGWVELGREGVSNTTDLFALYRKGPMGWAFPLHRLARDTWQLVREGTLAQRFRVASRLSRLNAQAFVLQFRTRARGRHLERQVKAESLAGLTGS